MYLLTLEKNYILWDILKLNGGPTIWDKSVFIVRKLKQKSWLSTETVGRRVEDKACPSVQHK